MKIFLALLLLLNSSMLIAKGFEVPSAPQATATQKQEPVANELEAEQTLKIFVQPEYSKDFLQALGKYDRDTGIKDSPETKARIFHALDSAVPLIHVSCDLDVRYRFLGMAYAARAEQEGALESIRKISIGFLDTNEESLKGISSSCRSELKRFGNGILEIYGQMDISKDTKSKTKEAPVAKEIKEKVEVKKENDAFSGFDLNQLDKK